MEHLRFDYCEGRAMAAPSVVVGVVASGNLEVMVEATPGAGCTIDVTTTARGFDAVWAAVLADFHGRAGLGGVRISINDVGATPAVVSLRLDQALEEFRAGAVTAPGR